MLAAEQLRADLVVLVAGMVPAAGESPEAWWDNTGHEQAIREQAGRDGGLTGSDDPFVSFLHDVPRPLAEEAMSRGRDVNLSDWAVAAPWPLEALSRPAELAALLDGYLG